MKEIINLRIKDKELHKRLKRFALDAEITMITAVETLLKEALDRHE